MPAESHAESTALRKALRELVALSTIPAAWVGREPPVIAAGLADVLVGSLRLDFAFVRLYDPRGGTAAEGSRGNGWEAFPEWLRTHPGGDHFSCKEIVADLGGAEPCRGVVIPVGVNGEAGLVAAACARTDFPSEIDQLLLSVAANHAAAAFQNALLRHELDMKVAELREARNELEMKVAERTADLRRSEAYLADAQRLTHTGSWACNINTRKSVHSSAEHSRLYGFDPDNGLPSFEEFWQRVHPEDQAGIVEALERANSTGKDFEAHFRVVLPDGTTRFIYCVGHPVFNPSGDGGVLLGISMDITERRRADEERERLRQVQADLAHLSRVTTMGELTASLAHEIRQPIAAAATNAKTCLRWLGRDYPNVEEASQAAARMVKDVTRAGEIISSISLMFKKDALQRELVDVNELIREMNVLLRSEANRYSISIRTELAGNLPKVMADRVQLQQVLMNLMLNGIDAMKETSGESELTIKSEANRGQLLISVSDTGVGLPQEQADQIFRAFFTTKDKGTGMGLPISRSIIESHGGRLWATGASGPGATFQFTLPVTVAAHA
jgi:C4-dicarboxylate-specific signal transduction histidine kinase